MPSMAIAALPGLRPAAALTSGRQCHPWPLPPAGPPPGGRTSGRPCSCALWRAACVQTNPFPSLSRACPRPCFNRWAARGRPCPRACCGSKRSQDGEAQRTRREPRPGGPRRTSSERARATPSPRDHRQPARWHEDPVPRGGGWQVGRTVGLGEPDATLAVTAEAARFCARGVPIPLADGFVVVRFLRLVIDALFRSTTSTSQRVASGQGNHAAGRGAGLSRGVSRGGVAARRRTAEQEPCDAILRGARAVATRAHARVHRAAGAA